MSEAKFMRDRVAEAIARAAVAGDDFGGQARAAINAMREPTEGMVDRGDIYADGPGYAAKVWHEMIDEALK